MPATDLYRTVLSDVVEESEIPESKIISPCHEREAVDARYVLVYLLHKRLGLYPSRINAITGICERSINYILTFYEQRYEQSKFLRNIADTVSYKLRKHSEQTNL